MAESAQSVDPNGFLLIKGCPLSSYGVFDYGAGQVGDPGDDPMRVVKVFRPMEVVNNPELIESLQSMPFIDNHDYLNGDPNATEDEGMAPEEKGVDGVITDNVYWQDPWLRGDLKVFSRKLRAAIQNGKKDLSLGYTSRFTYAPGTWKGQPYEYVQTDMRGNHIALVDEGRVAGARVVDGRVFDSVSISIDPSVNQKEVPAMENETQDGNELAELQAALQALLPKLQAALGGASGGEAAPAPGGEGAADPTASATPAPGGESGNEDGEFNLGDAVKLLDELIPKLKEKAGMSEGGQPQEGKEDPATVGDNEETEDAIDGLANGKPESSVEPVEAAEGKPDGQEGGKPSEGPKKGSNTQGGDSAMQRFYKDQADRQKYYDLISAEHGSFVIGTMDAASVVAYGLKKNGLTATKGAERATLDAYYMGRGKTAKAATVTKTADSVASFAPLNAYLSQ